MKSFASLSSDQMFGLWVIVCTIGMGSCLALGEVQKLVRSAESGWNYRECVKHHAPKECSR